MLKIAISSWSQNGQTIFKNNKRKSAVPSYIASIPASKDTQWISYVPWAILTIFTKDIVWENTGRSAKNYHSVLHRISVSMTSRISTESGKNWQHRMCGSTNPYFLNCARCLSGGHDKLSNREFLQGQLFDMMRELLMTNPFLGLPDDKWEEEDKLSNPPPFILVWKQLGADIHHSYVRMWYVQMCCETPIYILYVPSCQS